VWEVIEILRLVGNRLDRAAAYLGFSEASVRAALAYHDLDRPYPVTLAQRLRELREDVVALGERPETASRGDAASGAGPRRPPAFPRPR
jgi:hypothetical protein